MQSSLPSSSAGSSLSFDSAWKTVGTFKKPPKNIVITKDTLSDIKLAKKRTQQAISQNKKDQQRVDLDVILSGFPRKPNLDEVVGKLVTLMKLSPSDVRLYHQFENRASSKIFHHVAISLKDKTSKLKLLKAKSEMKGPIRLSMLVSTPAKKTPQDDPIITCLPSLSKFNYSVQRQLTRLQSHGIIAEFEFGDAFHRFKVHPHSAWKEVSHLEVLTEMNEILEIRNKTLPSRTRD